jgi:hypothetical protein
MRPVNKDGKRLLRESRLMVHRGTLLRSSASVGKSRSSAPPPAAEAQLPENKKQVVSQRKTHGDTVRTMQRLQRKSKGLIEQMGRLTEQTDALAETHRTLMQEAKRRRKTQKK